MSLSLSSSQRTSGGEGGGGKRGREGGREGGVNRFSKCQYIIAESVKACYAKSSLSLLESTLQNLCASETVYIAVLMWCV